MEQRCRKGVIKIVMILACIFLLASACSAEEISRTTMKIYIGKTCRLRIDGTTEKVTWSSSNSSVASVDRYGRVTALSFGDAVVTGKLAGGKTFKCNVYTRKTHLDRTSRTMIKGKKFRLTLYGADPAKWSTSKTAVAYVSPGGVVYAKGAGTAKITCRDTMNRTYTCTITVVEPTVRILFVGNSKTSNGDIPGQFEQLCKAAGKNVVVSSVTKGAYTLKDLAESETYAANMTAEAYDYCVIQEQTDAATWDALFLTGAKKVQALVRQKNPNVRMVVRQTWYSQCSDRDVRDCVDETASYVASMLPTTYLSVEGRPMYYADSIGIPVFLREGDVHQSKVGAYLCACSVYKCIFGSPVGIHYVGQAGSYASELQKLAAASW